MHCPCSSQSTTTNSFYSVLELQVALTLYPWFSFPCVPSPLSFSPIFVIFFLVISSLPSSPHLTLPPSCRYTDPPLKPQTEEWRVLSWPHPDWMLYIYCGSTPTGPYAGQHEVHCLDILSNMHTHLLYVAVPCRNRRLFHRVFRLHCCVRSAVSLNFH